MNLQINNPMETFRQREEARSLIRREYHHLFGGGARPNAIVQRWVIDLIIQLLDVSAVIERNYERLINHEQGTCPICGATPNECCIDAQGGARIPGYSCPLRPDEKGPARMPGPWKEFLKGMQDQLALLDARLRGEA